jgi:hypothetical protein
MAITINSDRITIGSKNIVIVPNGIMIEHGTFYAPEISAGQGRGTIGAQGTVAGYVVGGQASPNSPLATGSQTVERYSFASDGNSTQLPGVLYPDLTGPGAYYIFDATASSSTHAYTMGGNLQPNNASTNSIGRFPFANSWSTGSSAGTLTGPRERAGATQSKTFGYVASGYSNQTNQPLTSIERFPFTAETTNSTLIGNLTRVAFWPSTSTNGINAYFTGGSPAISDAVDRFSFSSEFGNTVLVGSLPVGTYYSTGHSSTISGYHLGGVRGGGTNPYKMAYIYKYPFATETVSNLGNMPTSRVGGSGSSSVTTGYIAGGSTDATNINPYFGNTITKFQFAADTTHSSVGTLSRQRAFSGGAQY